MAILAQGATELMLALATPAPKGYWGVPVLLWGAPGTGKSTFVESLHQKNFPVVTMIASLHDPTDFSGLPMLKDGQMHFAPPEWVHEFDQPGQGVLFLDELTTAPPTVQAALLRLVLERKVGAYSLPRGVRIIAAANPPEIAASGWELNAPLANRFVHLQWQLEGETYCNALEAGFEKPTLPPTDKSHHDQRSHFWRALVAGFLKRKPELVHTQPSEGEYAFASPRTWDFAITLMATCELHHVAPRPGGESPSHTQPFLNLLKGCVGSGVATAFANYLRQLRIPDPEEVLNGKVMVDTSLRGDEFFVLFAAMANYLRRYYQQNSQQNSPHLLPAITIFLQQAERVAEAKQADSIYTTLRALVKENILRAAAQQDPKVSALVKRLGRYYELLTEALE